MLETVRKSRGKVSASKGLVKISQTITVYFLEENYGVMRPQRINIWGPGMRMVIYEKILAGTHITYVHTVH